VRSTVESMVESAAKVTVAGGRGMLGSW